MFPRVRGVSDRAGSVAASPCRLHRCGLRSVSKTSAPRTTHSFRRGACVFRTIVTDRFGIVTAEFGNVTVDFGDVTNGLFAPA
jgi:hypothetical protein